MEFIDTHTHITDEAFSPGEQDGFVQRALEAGVNKMLLADIDTRERPAMYEAAAGYPGILYPMLGLYPGSVGKNWRDEIDALEAWKGKGAVAVGEIGLDYHYGAEFKEEQKEAETILTAEAAKKYTLSSFFGDWHPDKVLKATEKKAKKLIKKTF